MLYVPIPGRADFATADVLLAACVAMEHCTEYQVYSARPHDPDEIDAFIAMRRHLARLENEAWRDGKYSLMDGPTPRNDEIATRLVIERRPRR